MYIIFADIFILITHRLVKIIKAYIYNFFIIILAKLAWSKDFGDILARFIWLLKEFLVGVLLIFLYHHELVWFLRVLLFKEL